MPWSKVRQYIYIHSQVPKYAAFIFSEDAAFMPEKTACHENTEHRQIQDPFSN